MNRYYFAISIKKTIQINEMEKNYCLSDIGYYQSNPLSDGEYIKNSTNWWIGVEKHRLFEDSETVESFVSDIYFTKATIYLTHMKISPSLKN